MVRIGTAGWTLPRQHAAEAPGEGSHLARYARALHCVEINSSFYRSHRVATWQRWAASTPEHFRFSVKLPKAITHGAKLAVEPASLDAFCGEIGALGDRLGTILMQLPPSLCFDDCPAAEFFEALRNRYSGPVACEPRHLSWFTNGAHDLLDYHRVSRVAADPSRDPRTAAGQLPVPGGWPGLAYFRLHGSPRTYYSDYSASYLAQLADSLLSMPALCETWILFDNTSLGHALGNALHLQKLIAGRTLAPDNMRPEVSRARK